MTTVTNNANVELSIDEMEAVSGGFGPALLVNLAAAALAKGAGIAGGAAGWLAGGSSDPIPWRQIIAES